MPRHGLGEAEPVGTPGAQEVVPGPQVGAELGIVPGATALVVVPDVTNGIIGVHDIAVVPEAVPTPSLALPDIMLHERVKVIVEVSPGRRRAIDRAPGRTEDPAGMVV